MERAKRTTFSLNDETNVLIQKYARELQMPKSEFIRFAIKEFHKNKEEK